MGYLLFLFVDGDLPDELSHHAFVELGQLRINDKVSVFIFCNTLENSSLMKKAKIIHALCHIVSVYFLEVCQVTWHL